MVDRLRKLTDCDKLEHKTQNMATCKYCLVILNVFFVYNDNERVEWIRFDLRMMYIDRLSSCETTGTYYLTAGRTYFVYKYVRIISECHV